MLPFFERFFVSILNSQPSFVIDCHHHTLWICILSIFNPQLSHLVRLLHKYPPFRCCSRWKSSKMAFSRSVYGARRCSSWISLILFNWTEMRKDNTNRLKFVSNTLFNEIKFHSGSWLQGDHTKKQCKWVVVLLSKKGVSSFKKDSFFSQPLLFWLVHSHHATGLFDFYSIIIVHACLRLKPTHARKRHLVR